MRVIALAAVLFLLAVSASWGGTVAVSGSATLDGGGHGSVTSISCAAPGDCVAGGSYRQGQYSEAFVVSETNGSWGDASGVPGAPALGSVGCSHVLAISCAAAG